MLRRRRQRKEEEKEKENTRTQEVAFIGDGAWTHRPIDTERKEKAHPKGKERKPKRGRARPTRQ